MKVATNAAVEISNAKEQNPPPPIPPLPFSSPAGEGIGCSNSKLSKTSPSVLNDKAMDETGLYNGLLHSRAYSGEKTDKSHQRASPGQGEASNTRSRWPHSLNVVTNFSKPPQLAERAADKSRTLKQDAVDALQKGHGRMNSSADVKTPDGYKRRNSNGEKRQHRSNDKGYDAALGLHSHDFENTRKAPSPPRHNKGPVGHLKRASTKMSTLSPSDRPIVIGISVPSDKLDQHTVSPDTGPAPASLSSRQYGGGRGPSDAPTVLITPARAESTWSASPDDHFKPGRQRAPSSVYSRATNARATPKQSDVPPVPTRPRRSPSLSSDPANRQGLDTRIHSAYTVFDEDESPNEASRERPTSGESRSRILRRSSTDTIATRHRSQGWWNHIVSPFLPKPGAVPWRSTSRTIEPAPHLPGFAPRTALMDNHQPSDGQSSTRSKRSSSGHTSIWTDVSPEEAERQTAEITMLHSPFQEHARGLENPVKDLSDWFEGLGAAAEYYHACWHDQRHPTPYFECQGHTCSPRRPGDLPPALGPCGTSKAPPEISADHRGIDSPAEHKGHGANEFQQTPANRFSAAFKESLSPKSKIRDRSGSEMTVIEDVDGTPVVHEAQAAPIVRAAAPVPAAQPPLPTAEGGGGVEVAKTLPMPPVFPRSDSKKPPLAHFPSAEESPRDADGLGTTKPSGPRAPAISPPKARKPVKRIVAVMPPGHPSVRRAYPLSPSPASPTAPANESMRDQIGINKLPQNGTLPSNSEDVAVPTTIINHYYSSVESSRSIVKPSPRPAWSPNDIWRARENEKSQPEDSKQQDRSCFPKFTACVGRGKPKTKKQRWLLIGITSVLVFMIVLILLLAMLLTRKGDAMEVQSQWLNLTGFPPMPTGISTVIQPDPVGESSACVRPATLWSCSVPKEQQASIAPNNPNQPNFRLEIRFQNGSIAHGGALKSTGVQKRSHSRRGNAVAAGSMIKSQLLRVRDFTSNLFTPSPIPPTREDQIFLGNTTDKNQQPFDGEITPFFISFISPERLPSLKMSKRNEFSLSNSTAGGTDPFPNLEDIIPRPSITADGTASPALLYPLATAQPLRLYDRNIDTEHYGFYTYFDRSIFLRSNALINFTNTSPSEISEDENGGAAEDAAKVRCTWAQTRFLIQIWTRKGDGAPLLQSSNSSSRSRPDSRPKNLTESSANNFSQPEILVHAAAPSRGSDDARYRKEALGILRFDCIKRHDILPTNTGALDKTSASGHVPPTLPQDSNTSTDPAPRLHLTNALTNWATPALTRPSPKLLVGRTPAPPLRDRASLRGADVLINRTPIDQQRPKTAPSGPYTVQETPNLPRVLSDSFATPPSIIPDSQPTPFSQQKNGKRPYEENSSPSPTHHASAKRSKARVEEEGEDPEE
ncbi:MAG: hypothetical protein Q9173_004887, partial [Seirophora scorigena]